MSLSLRVFASERTGVSPALRQNALHSSSLHLSDLLLISPGLFGATQNKGFGFGTGFGTGTGTGLGGGLGTGLGFGGFGTQQQQTSKYGLLLIFPFLSPEAVRLQRAHSEWARECFKRRLPRLPLGWSRLLQNLALEMPGLGISVLLLMKTGSKDTSKKPLSDVFILCLYFASQNVIALTCRWFMLAGEAGSAGGGAYLVFFIQHSTRKRLVQPARPDTRPIEPAHQHSQRPLGSHPLGR